MSVIWSVDNKETSRDYLISLSGQCALAGNWVKKKLSMIENRQNVRAVFVSSGGVTSEQLKLRGDVRRLCLNL